MTFPARCSVAPAQRYSLLFFSVPNRRSVRFRNRFRTHTNVFIERRIIYGRKRSRSNVYAETKFIFFFFKYNSSTRFSPSSFGTVLTFFFCSSSINFRYFRQKKWLVSIWNVSLNARTTSRGQFGLNAVRVVATREKTWPARTRGVYACRSCVRPSVRSTRFFRSSLYYLIIKIKCVCTTRYCGHRRTVGTIGARKKKTKPTLSYQRPGSSTNLPANFVLRNSCRSYRTTQTVECVRYYLFIFLSIFFFPVMKEHRTKGLRVTTTESIIRWVRTFNIRIY